MDGEMDEYALLKYVRFQILPSQNRYQAFAFDGNNDEFLIEGLLEQLTRHLPQVKDFYFEGSETCVKLQWPKSSSPAAWFSKSTFRRFLSIANSTVVFNEIKAVEDEMCQLQMARKFHLSIYSQSESEVEIVSSDPSKNELLRAMDLRLKALREELAASLEQAAGSFCISKDISHMVNFCHSVGATALNDYLIKYSELNQISLVLDYTTDEKPTLVNATGCDDETGKGVSEPVVHVQYDGTMAERDNTTDNEDSSEDSDVEVGARDRSWSMVRSANPRRSASPMRRVQIARVGSRRATAIGIKSLNYFPGREKALNHNDDEAVDDISDEKVCENPPRKPETNEQRMSVQAAISLFEKKQREENTDTRKKSVGDIPKNVKPVLRKWNSCIEQSHVQSSAEAAIEDGSSLSAANLQDKDTQEVDIQKSDVTKVDVPQHAGEVDGILQSPMSLELSSPNRQQNTVPVQAEESTERLTASAKWNQQKEAELNMLMKMIEAKPVKHRQSIVNKSDPSEERGGFYDDYKNKRDEKLLGENATNQAEMESKFKAMQQIIENSKVDRSSKQGRRQSLHKPKTSATQPEFPNPKKKLPKETKPTTAKRGAVKPSSAPATRKSWPSPQPPLVVGASPSANSVTGVASSTATTRRKSQTPHSLACASPKVEKPLPLKIAKGSKSEPKTSSQGVTAMHRQPWARDTRPTKPKSLVSSEDFSDMVPAKTELPSKVVKKSSIVPVEPKPFLRKGSKVGPAVVPVITKSKASPRSKESVRKSGNTPCSLEKEVAIQSSPEQVDKHEIENLSHDLAEPALVSETLLNSDKKTMNTENPSKDTADGTINMTVTKDHSLAFEKEETTISPSAWVEEEENYDLPILPIPIDDSEVQFAIPTSVEMASPRMRQSLSQMLQEETNELENTEWLNFERANVTYSKDAPKGFKRLLKFGRKGKGDANSSGWSSPSMFSEGDDDGDDYKTAFQRNIDCQLRKSTTRTKNTSQLKPRFEGQDRKDSSYIRTREISKGTHRSSYEIGEGQSSSVGVPGTKSSRSFFSLSAFRGSK